MLPANKSEIEKYAKEIGDTNIDTLTESLKVIADNLHNTLLLHTATELGLPTNPTCGQEEIDVYYRTNKKLIEKIQNDEFIVQTHEEAIILGLVLEFALEACEQTKLSTLPLS